MMKKQKIEQLEKEVLEPKPSIEEKRVEQARELTDKLATLTADNPELMREVCSDFIRKFQEFREEDQDLIIKYLTTVTTAISGFVDKYMRELDLQARHREKEAEFLDMAKKVLSRYL